MTNENSSQCDEVSNKTVSPVGSPAPLPETLKRHRDDSCDTHESSAAPPSKAAKMAYSIMNILAKDKKEPRSNVANKENSADAHSVSPAPANADSQAQPLNPFFLNPFLAAAAAHSGQSHLLNNISNLAMMSKHQSADMWPWFNMAAMSALYGLDKGYNPGLFGSMENAHLRNVSTSSQSSYGHVTDNGTQLTRGNQSSSSASSSPSSADQGGKKSGQALNRSLEDEEEQGHRAACGGTSMADEDDLDNDELDEDLDGSNNGDSFDNMRKKKTRTVFSRNQVFQLESTFDMKRYLSSSERSSLANSLQLTETQIKIWFQNRRNKWKRQLAAEIEASGPNQHQQTQHQLSVTAGGLNGQRSSGSQRMMRVPVLYQAQEHPEHVQSSSSSSSHSSLHSPSNSSLNNVNPASMLSPSMLAAAAAASSLYYAAAAHAQPGTFQNFNLSMANNANNGSKQSISSVL